MEENQKDYFSIKINLWKKNNNKTNKLMAIFSTSSEYLTFSYENQSETQGNNFQEYFKKKTKKQTKHKCILIKTQILTFT